MRKLTQEGGPHGLVPVTDRHDRVANLGGRRPKGCDVGCRVGPVLEERRQVGSDMCGDPVATRKG